MDPLALPLQELAQSLQGMSQFVAGAVLLTAAGLIANLLSRRMSIGLQQAEQPVAASENQLSLKFGGGQVIHGSVFGPGDRFAAEQRMASQLAVWRLLRGAGCTGLIACCTLMAVEHHGANPILKYSLNRLQTRTGINLKFEQATGGPLQGEYRLHGVRLTRENHPESNFHLAVSDVTIRFTWWKLLCSPLTIDGLHAQQIAGDFQRTPRGNTDKPQPDSVPTPDAVADANRISNGVTVRHFEIEDAAITFTDSSTDGTPVEIKLTVAALECSPLRTNRAPYDILFRSNMTGSLDEKPFLVHSTLTDSGRRTEWTADGISIDLVRSYLGGPFRWLVGGTCDVSITQDVSNDPMVPVVLNTSLKLRELRAGLPTNTKPAVAVAVEILSSRVKSIPKYKELQFKLELDPRKFDLTKTEDQQRAWEQLRQATVAALLQTTGLNPTGAADEKGKRINGSANEVSDEVIKAIQRIRERKQQRRSARQKATEKEPESQ